MIAAVVTVCLPKSVDTFPVDRYADIDAAQLVPARFIVSTDPQLICRNFNVFSLNHACKRTPGERLDINERDAAALSVAVRSDIPDKLCTDAEIVGFRQTHDLSVGKALICACGIRMKDEG